MIPKKAQWVEGWATFKGSDVIPSIDHVKRKFLDVHYGPDKLQTMDIYLPEGAAAPYPVFILIHGGGLFTAINGISTYIPVSSHGNGVMRWYR